MITSTANAEYYKWGDNCDGWHLLRSDSLSVIQELMPPGTAEQLHYHQKARQVFYILSGTATFNVAGETQVVEAGQSIYILPGLAHCIANDGNNDLSFLVISEPKSHGDRINIGQ